MTRFRAAAEPTGDSRRLLTATDPVAMNQKKFRRASQLSPAERRAQLTHHAIKAFAENGIGRANHAQVAKLAGVAVSTVFSYFPTRENLVDSVLQDLENKLLAIVGNEASRPGATAFQKFLNLLSNYVNWIDLDPDSVKVFLDWTTSYEQFLAQRFQAYLHKLVALLTVIVEDGRARQEFGPEVDPVIASMMLYSSANTLAQLKFFNGDIDVTHYIVSLISAVLHLKDTEVERYQRDNNTTLEALPLFASRKDAITPTDQKRNFWSSHISAWKAGNLTQAEYCEAHALKLATFGYWRHKLRE
jgi:TetR/AcrR family hemagglutinin/protease transcriptional regulator